jgi:hypothetical protein
MINLRILFCAAVLAACVISVDAQATRTWVSGIGDDVNPCSRTAPCKTFAGAISKTAVHGEINCLDPAGYGTVTIIKSITIDCQDTQGSILAAGTNGVTVNLTEASDTKKSVKIRGLSINGAGTGVNGIRIVAANAVVIEDVMIDGFTTHGISVQTTAGTPRIVVDSASIRSNAGNGINTFIVGGTVSLSVSNSRINNNGNGLNFSGNTAATIFNSTIVGHSIGLNAANASAAVKGSEISHNTTGIAAGGGASIRLMGTMVTANGTGLTASGGGQIVSHVSNVLAGNGVNGTPSSSVPLQ